MATPSVLQAPPAGKVWRTRFEDNFDNSPGMSGTTNGIARPKWNSGWLTGPSPALGAQGEITTTTAPVQAQMVSYHDPGSVLFSAAGCHFRLQSGSAQFGRTLRSGCLTTAGLMVLNPRSISGVPAGPVNVTGQLVVEMKVRIPGPNSRAGGFWPVIWTTNANNYDNGGAFPGGIADQYQKEIDLWEQSNIPGGGSLGSNLGFFYHPSAISSYGANASPPSLDGTDLSLGFHTYTYWTDGTNFKLWIDGVQSLGQGITNPAPPASSQTTAEWGQPHYLILAFQAVGSPNFPTSSSGTQTDMIFDYVRVWDAAAATGAVLIADSLLGGGGGNGGPKDSAYYASLREDIEIMAGNLGNQLASPGWGHCMRMSPPGSGGVTDNVDTATMTSLINAGLKSACILVDGYNPSSWAARDATSINNYKASVSQRANEMRTAVNNSNNPNFEVIWEYRNEPNGHPESTNWWSDYAFWLHQFRDAVKLGAGGHPARPEQKVIAGGAWNDTTDDGGTAQGPSINFFQTGGGKIWGGTVDWFLNLDDATKVGAAHRISQIGLDGLGMHPYWESSSYQSRLGFDVGQGGGLNPPGWYRNLAHYNGFRYVTWCAYFFTTGTGGNTWKGGNGVADNAAFRIYCTEHGQNSAAGWQGGSAGTNKTYPTDWTIDGAQGSARTPTMTNRSDSGSIWNGGTNPFNVSGASATVQPPGAGWASGRGDVHDSGQTHQIFGENNIGTVRQVGRTIDVNVRVLVGLLDHPDKLGGISGDANYRFTHPRGLGVISAFPANFKTHNFIAKWLWFRIVDSTLVHGGAGEDSTGDWWKRGGFYYTRNTNPIFSGGLPSGPERGRKGAIGTSVPSAGPSGATAAGPLDMLEAIANTNDPRIASATVPGKTGGLLVFRGDAQVDLLWSAPNDGGSPILYYVVSLSIGFGNVEYTVVGTTGCSIFGLLNGINHTVTVRAVNAIGTGVNSDAKTFLPNGTVREEPWTSACNTVPDIQYQTVDNAIGTPNATLDFTANGTLHIHQLAPDGSQKRTVFWPRGQWTQQNREVRSTFVSTSTADASSLKQPGHVHRLISPGSNSEVALCIIRNVFFGDHIFKIFLMGAGVPGLTKDLGTFDTSVGGDPAGGGILTTYPLKVKSRFQGNVLDLAIWLPSESEPAYGSAPAGGPAPRTYTQTITDPLLPDIGFDGWYVAHMSDPTLDEIVLDDLSVTDVTSSGPSLPGAPTAPTATVPASTTNVQVRWTAPVSDGGAAITRYRVVSSPPLIDDTFNTPATLLRTYSGFAQNVAYTFVVSAINSVGQGPPSPSTNAVTPNPSVVSNPPGPPRNVLALLPPASTDLVQLSWQAPASPGSTAISSYHIVSSPALIDDTVDGTTFSAAYPDSYALDTAYRFTVTALNAAGPGLGTQSNGVIPNPSGTVVTPPPPGGTGNIGSGQLVTPPTALSDDDIIFLDRGLRQRADGFKFELYDDQGNFAGDVAVDASQGVSIHVDTGGTIMRTCDGVTIVPSDLRQIDPLRDRLKVSIVLQNGSVFPLGVFMFGQHKKLRASWGDRLQPDLFDQAFILDQDLGRSVSLKTGTSVRDVFLGLVAEAGILDVALGVADARVGDAVSWSASTTRVQALTDMAKMMGGLPPFFSNPGTLTIKAAPQPESTEPDHVYGPGGIIIVDSITEIDDSYQAPNQYVVISSGNDTDVIGVFDVPASAPHSAAQRGFVLRQTFPAQGLTTTAAADLVALSEYIVDSRTFRTATFSTLLNPRHDIFDIVEYDGVLYVETGWSMELKSGGAHSHDVSRLW